MTITDLLGRQEVVKIITKSKKVEES